MKLLEKSLQNLYICKSHNFIAICLVALLIRNDDNPSITILKAISESKISSISYL